jgi:hypothetical protein
MLPGDAKSELTVPKAIPSRAAKAGPAWHVLMPARAEPKVKADPIIKRLRFTELEG